MDIKDLYSAANHEKGAEVEILHPDTDEPTGFFVTVMGRDSKIYRQKRLKRDRASATEKPSNKDDFSIVIDSCVAWRGFQDKGKDIPFDLKVLETLLDESPAIAMQLALFSAKRENFTKN